jgi:hypothetical protein
MTWVKMGEGTRIESDQHRSEIRVPQVTPCATRSHVEAAPDIGRSRLRVHTNFTFETLSNQPSVLQCCRSESSLFVLAGHPLVENGGMPCWIRPISP